MIQGENLKISLSKGNNLLLKTAAIAAAIVTLGAAYSFFMTNFYKPKVEVLSVDFDNGIAKIKIKGHPDKIIDISGDTVYGITGDWGIRLGSVVQNGKLMYNRIELLKKGMVEEYLNRP
jgi:hypothetical protein